MSPDNVLFVCFTQTKELNPQLIKVFSENKLTEVRRRE